MKRLLLFFVVSVTTQGWLSARDITKEELIGGWRNVDGDGAIWSITYSADGTYVGSFDSKRFVPPVHAALAGKWKLEGSKLVLFDETMEGKKVDEGKEHSVTIVSKAVGEFTTLPGRGGVSRLFKRVKNEPNQPPATVINKQG